MKRKNGQNIFTGNKKKNSFCYVTYFAKKKKKIANNDILHKYN